MSTIIKQKENVFRIKDISNNGVIKGQKEYIKSVNIKTDNDKYKQNKVFAKSSELKVNDYKNKVIDTKRVLTTETNKINNKYKDVEYKKTETQTQTNNKIIKTETQINNNKNKIEDNLDKSKNKFSNNKEDKENKRKNKNNRYSLSKKVLKGAEYTVDNILIDNEEDLGINTIIKTKVGIKGTLLLNEKRFQINKKIGKKAFNIVTSEQAKSVYANTISVGQKLYKTTENIYNNIYFHHKVNSIMKKNKNSDFLKRQRKKILLKARKRAKEQAENLVRLAFAKVKSILISFFTKKIAVVSFIIIALVSTLISVVVGITSIFGFSINLSLDDDLTMIFEYISELDSKINYQIDNVKKTYSADNYIFNVPHRAETNKEQVYAFIKAKYGDKNISDEIIKAEIQQIHNNIYDLSFNETSHTHTTQNEDGTTSTYTTITLTTTLKSKSFDDFYEKNKDTLLEEHQQKDYINILELIKENAGKILNNPFPNIDWRNYISSDYGYRIDPISKEFKKHTGLDIALSQGTEIHSCMSGKVETFNSGNSGFGLHLTVTNGKYKTLYAHCSEILVKNGDMINAGDVIAKVGSTGYSTGPHLHLEYFVNGVRKNPKAYLKVYKGGK